MRLPHMLGVVIALAATGAMAQQTRTAPPENYDWTGSVTDFQETARPQRPAPSQGDSVGAGAATNGRNDTQRVPIPSPCEFDNTLAGCPGYNPPGGRSARAAAPAASPVPPAT